MNEVKIGKGKSEVKEGKGRTEVKEGNGKSEVKEGMGKSKVKVGKGKSKVKEGKGKSEVKEGKDMNEVKEGKCKNEVMEGFGRRKRRCEGINEWIGTVVWKNQGQQGSGDTQFLYVCWVDSVSKVNAQVLLQHMFCSILYISSSNEHKVQMKIFILKIKGS
jgi:hypothetical protein